MSKMYLCIDLKSFYASVECVDRGLDSMTTNLVVADKSRGKGTICLAVSPSLKALGVKNRCRVFEISKDLDYIMATPRMKRYMEVSVLIYQIYLKYVSADDIHVYSIDECFLDISDYLKLYEMEPKELAKKIIKDIYDSTGIVASAGIGTNLYLTKIALDITAKKSFDHIGYLDENLFKETLRNHKPLSDFWGISTGISNRLAKYNVFDMEGIAHLPTEILYKEFGVNAELLIDHSFGYESTEMSDIKKYRSKSNSLSNSQVLFEDYSYDNGLIVLKEMVDDLVLELHKKHLVATSFSLTVKYSRNYNYSYSGGVRRMGEATNNVRKLMKYFTDLYAQTTEKDGLIRGIGIGFSILPEEFRTLDLFTDELEENKENNLSNTINHIRDKFGASSIFKAMSLQEKATQLERNKFIGGHKSGERKDG